MVILYTQNSSKSITLKYEAVSPLYTLYSLWAHSKYTIRKIGKNVFIGYLCAYFAINVSKLLKYVVFFYTCMPIGHFLPLPITFRCVGPSPEVIYPS